MKDMITKRSITEVFPHWEDALFIKLVFSGERCKYFFFGLVLQQQRKQRKGPVVFTSAQKVENLQEPKHTGIISV